MTVMPRFDNVQEQAIELGERNAAAIELVRKHCANAQIEHHPMGGIGLIEQMTGLPIGRQTVTCEHAAKPPDFAGAEFLPVALSFYKNNCVGCPHRILVGIPNLATVSHEIDEQEQEEAERRELAERETQAERDARHRAREQRVMNEPQTTRELIRLVNLQDADDRLSEPGEELVATVKAAPQFVTAPAVGVLLEAAENGLSEHILEAVRVAAEASRIPPDEALRVSATALANNPRMEAARTLLRFRAGVTPALLAPAHRWLLIMVGRNFGPSFGFPDQTAVEERWAVWGGAFDLLVDIDLAGVLMTIERMLESEQEYDRERAAAAVEVLVDRHPEIIVVVAHQLVTAIGKSAGDDRFGIGERAADAIKAALTRCLLHKPQETSQAIETGAQGLTDEQRYDLFHAYDSVIRHHRSEGPVSAATGAVVLEACLKHTKGDWGEETRRAAYDLLELISKWQGHLLDDQPEALFSLLLEAISSKTPEAPPLERANAPMWFLENMSSTFTRNARIRDIRETIGNLAVRRPREVLDLITTFLGDDSLQTDEAREMRAECTWLLGFVGKRSDFLTEVMPLLYSGIVHSEQLVRYCAIEGLQEVAEGHPAEAIPIEFSATLPALLSDPYMIVHKTITRALTRGVPVRDEHRGQVVGLLLNLADYYAKNGNDSDMLEDALRALRIWGRYDDDPSTTIVINRIAARMAKSLDAYDLQHFLEWGGRDMLDLPEYADALVDALQRPEIIREPNSGDARVRELLYRVQAVLLVPHAGALHDAAMAHLPLNPWSALEYVEVLQRLRLWAEAVQLAEDVVAAVPETIDHAVKRTYAERVRAAARVEAAVALGSSTVEQLLAESAAAAEAHEEARANSKTEYPWPS
jgi:hypothetical protein